MKEASTNNMKTVFPKYLPAFVLFLTLCFLLTNTVRANKNFSNAAVGTVSKVATVNAVDNPSIFINNVSLNEGNSGTTFFNFTVSLLDPSSQTVTVNYSTANGTATAPSDFQAASGTVSFAPGETVKAITILVNGDTQVESNETFTVILSNAVNATIAVGTATGTILNDDGPGCTYSISPSSLNTNANGSSGNTFFVTTQAGCVFNATTSDSFITIDSGANSTGSGTVSFSVAANSGAARTGTIQIAGQVFTINQAAFGSSGLRVSITDSPDPVTFGNGQDINYTIVVTNDGASSATGVVLTDTLPSGVNFISASTSTGSCSHANGVVTCSLGNVFNTATINIIARPTSPGTYTNTVSVTGNEQDSNLSDNSASATTTVNPQNPVSTDLRVTVFNSPSVVTLGSGQTIIYSIFVDNDGPSRATGVVVTSTLSQGLDFVSASTNSGSCSFASGVVTCNIGTLDVGTSIFITARPTIPGTATNTVSVRGNEPDPVTSNNTVTKTTLINPAPGTVYADLRLTVFPPLNPVAFRNIDYQIFVNNDGPSPATGVIVTDTLPSNVTFISATSNQGTCSFANGVVTCNLGTVTNGVNISIMVNPTVEGIITNTVSVRGNEPDFNTSNNTVTTVSSVAPSTKTRRRIRAF
jgi:uncharacterized repeat protein (TIGR01451 family)